MDDRAEGEHAFVVIFVVESVVIGRRRRPAQGLAARVAAAQDRAPRAVGRQHQRGRRHEAATRPRAARKPASGQAPSSRRRNFQHQVAEDAAEPGRQRPGGRRGHAAGNRREQKCCAKPARRRACPCRSTPRPLASAKPQITAGTRAATDDRPKNCMARSEKTAPGIAHRVGDEIVGGVAEARIVAHSRCQARRSRRRRWPAAPGRRPGLPAGARMGASRDRRRPEAWKARNACLNPVKERRSGQISGCGGFEAKTISGRLKPH